MSDEDAKPTFTTYVTTAQCVYGPFSALGKLSDDDRASLVERLREDGHTVVDGDTA